MGLANRRCFNQQVFKRPHVGGWFRSASSTPRADPADEGWLPVAGFPLYEIRGEVVRNAKTKRRVRPVRTWGEPQLVYLYDPPVRAKLAHERRAPQARHGLRLDQIKAARTPEDHSAGSIYPAPLGTGGRRPSARRLPVAFP